MGVDMSDKWSDLLDFYLEIDEDPFWAHLRQPGIKLVRGDGQATVNSRVMLVGEAPGARENGAGRPFVGASGIVLADLLGLAGLARDGVFITNVVKYRPPGNRTPIPREVLHATEALRTEWSILRPALTIAVGSPAHTALRSHHGIPSMVPHGELWPFGSEGEHWVTSVYHPAFGLRRKNMQSVLEREWELLGDQIKEVFGDSLP